MYPFAKMKQNFFLLTLLGKGFKKLKRIKLLKNLQNRMMKRPKTTLKHGEPLKLFCQKEVLGNNYSATLSGEIMVKIIENCIRMS